MNLSHDTLVLDAVRFASLVAPAVTRPFVSGMRAMGEEGPQLVQSYGGTPAGGLIDLRNPLAAGRSLAIEDVVRTPPTPGLQLPTECCHRTSGCSCLPTLLR